MRERERAKRLESALLDPTDERTREILTDVILMVALADPPMSYEDIERVTRAAATYVELEGISSEWIARRSRELRADAPHFQNTRPHLAQELAEPRARRFALGLAAKVFGEERGLRDEESALLHLLADAFRIPRSERNLLFSPWNAPRGRDGESRRVRSAFNAPDGPAMSLFDAMFEAENDTAFRLLTQKLSALRTVVTKFFEGAEVLEIGELIPIGPHGFRADGILAHKSQHWIVRLLAKDESLHPLELSILVMLLQRLNENTHVLIAHAGPLFDRDREALDSRGMDLIRRESF